MRAPLRLLFVLLVLALITAPQLSTPASAAACHWGSCSPGSYGAWSPYVNCDPPFCGYDSYCDAKGTDATLQLKERYRVHNYPDGSQCTEYQVISYRFRCGCNE